MRPKRIRQFGVQVVRRLTQAAAVGLVVSLAYLSLYGHYHAAKAVDEIPRLRAPDRPILLALERAVSSRADPERFLEGFRGTLWSMRLAGVDVSDPLAAAELVASSKTLHGPMLLSIWIPVVLAVLLGRVFCSWVCPGYLLFEVGSLVRRFLRFLELPPAGVRFSRNNKYFFLGLGLLAAAVTSRPLFAMVYPPAVASRLVHSWVFGTALTGMLVLLGVVLAFEVLVSPRWFCRTLCPGGALLGLLGAARLLRVRFDPEKCTSCGRCAPACEQGLRPIAESGGIECDNCGRCVRRCPEGALTWHAGRPWGPRARPAATAALSAGLALLVLDAAPARGHHILGLPHYSYRENYPQVPILEYGAQTGPWDVLLTSYPGRPKPGDRVNLAFYIKNRMTGEAYGPPIRVRVLQTFTFGENRVVAAGSLDSHEQVYKITVPFDRDGEHVVELSMKVEGQTEVIPFLLMVGEPSSAWGVLAGVGLGLAAFVVTVRAVKIKRRRAREGRQEETQKDSPCPAA